jgi:hypothetical protein
LNNQIRTPKKAGESGKKAIEKTGNMRNKVQTGKNPVVRIFIGKTS